MFSINHDNAALSGLEQRRTAARLLQEGWSPSQVAEKVGVTRQTAHSWCRVLHSHGPEELVALRRGRPAHLAQEQIEALQIALLAGPDQPHSKWSIKAASRRIHQVCGVEYSATQVWRILSALGLRALRGKHKGES